MTIRGQKLKSFTLRQSGKSCERLARRKLPQQTKINTHYKFEYDDFVSYPFPIIV